MRAYSLDLRQRVVDAYDAGMPLYRIVELFRVSGPTIKRYIAQRRQTGSIAPRPIPGRTATIRPAQYPDLIAQLEAMPDATLKEHCLAWQQSHGQKLSIWAMWRAIRRVGWTPKKTRTANLAGVAVVPGWRGSPGAGDGSAAEPVEHRGDTSARGAPCAN